MNFIEFAMNLFDGIVNLSTTIWDFLFQNHTIGFEGFEILGVQLFNFTVNLNIMQMMFSGGIVVFLLLSLAKKYIPFL